MQTHNIYIKPSTLLLKINTKKLLDFLSSICNTVSFSMHLNYYKLSISEYSNALSDYLDYYKNEDKKRRNQFSKDYEYRNSLLEKYSSIDEVNNYFDRLREYDLVQFAELKDVLKRHLTKDTRHLSIVNDSVKPNKNDISMYTKKYINSKFTLGTHCTIGDLYKEYRYKLDNDIINLLLSSESLFSSYSVHTENTLEDPGFYFNDKLVCSICSHEHTTNLFLNEGEYKDFCLLEISHNKKY